MKKNLTQASDIGNGEAVPVCEEGAYGMSLYLPFNFALNLNLLQKNQVFTKKYLNLAWFIMLTGSWK